MWRAVGGVCGCGEKWEVCVDVESSGKCVWIWTAVGGVWMLRAVGGVCVDVNSSGRCVDVESSGKCVSMWRAVVFNLFGPKEHQISLTFK